MDQRFLHKLLPTRHCFPESGVTRQTEGLTKHVKTTNKIKIIKHVMTFSPATFSWATRILWRNSSTPTSVRKLCMKSHEVLQFNLEGSLPFHFKFGTRHYFPEMRKKKGKKKKMMGLKPSDEFLPCPAINKNISISHPLWQSIVPRSNSTHLCLNVKWETGHYEMNERLKGTWLNLRPSHHST